MYGHRVQRERIFAFASFAIPFVPDCRGSFVARASSHACLDRAISLPLARDCCRLDGWILINRNDRRTMQNHRSFDSRVTRCTRFLSQGTRSSDHRNLVHACFRYLAVSTRSLSRGRRWRLSREASWQLDQRPKQQKHQTNIQTCRQTNGQTYTNGRTDRCTTQTQRSLADRSVPIKLATVRVLQRWR